MRPFAVTLPSDENFSNSVVFWENSWHTGVAGAAVVTTASMESTADANAHFIFSFYFYCLK